jgi:hypothetical protein
MSKDAPGTFKEWLPSQRKYSDDAAGDITSGLLDDLESIRISLGMYPQAFRLVVQQVEETPYDDGDGIVDGFVALRILDILQEFAKRLERIGICDIDDPNQELAHVDLSAARESDGMPTAEEVRQSFLDDGSRPSEETDREVADSADLASDSEIRDSFGAERIDAAMDDIASGEIADALGYVGIDLDHGDFEDGDDVSGEDGGGGDGRIQLGTLDREGTDRDPTLCAMRTTKVLFEGVVRGFNGSDESRPGLADRIHPLEEYDEVDMTAVRIELHSLLLRVSSITFRDVDECERD